MHRFTWLACIALLGCTDAPVAEPIDTPDPPGELPARYLISRGAVGLETLFAVTGETSVAISTPGSTAWCGSKPFCNLPPNGDLGRFVGTRIVDDTHAFYVDLDVEAWSGTRVVSADLATGAQSELASGVPWPTTTPEWPLYFVVSTATQGSTTWVSLPIEGGMALYRTDGRAALTEVARVPQPAGRTYMESSISTSSRGVAWSVRWRGGPAEDPHTYVTRVFDGDGEIVLRVPEDIAGAIDGGDEAYVVDDTVAITWQDASLGYAVELFRFGGGARVRIPGAAYVHHHVAGGEGVIALGTPADNRIRLIDASTGAVETELDGWPYRFTDGRVVYRRNGSSELVERTLASGDERVLAPGTSISLDAMGGVLARDGATLAVGSGAPFFDLSDNVGIELVDLATLARVEVEPADSSERFVRRMQFTSNSDWLLYLHPIEGVLQLVGYRVDTGERRTLTTGSEPVRQLTL